MSLLLSWLAQLFSSIFTAAMSAPAETTTAETSGTNTLPPTPVDKVLARYGVLALMLCTLMSCTIGLRRETRVVYASIATEPEAVKGLVRVATNDKIPVTVGDEHLRLDLGGYYVVSAADLQTMITALKGE